MKLSPLNITAIGIATVTVIYSYGMLVTRVMANENKIDLNAVYNTNNPRKPYTTNDFGLIQSLLFDLNGGTPAQLKALKGHQNTINQREDRKKQAWIKNYKENNPDATDTDALIAYKIDNKS